MHLSIRHLYFRQKYVTEQKIVHQNGSEHKGKGN